MGFRSNGNLIYNREKIYRTVYPIFEEIIEPHYNSPSEKNYEKQVSGKILNGLFWDLIQIIKNKFNIILFN